MYQLAWASLVVQMVRNQPAMRKTQVQSLGWEDPLEKEMETHSSILAWRIPWTEEPGGLQSRGSQRVGHDLVTNTHTHQLVQCLILGTVSCFHQESILQRQANILSDEPHSINGYPRLCRRLSIHPLTLWVMLIDLHNVKNRLLLVKFMACSRLRLMHSQYEVEYAKHVKRLKYSQDIPSTPCSSFMNVD